MPLCPNTICKTSPDEAVDKKKRKAKMDVNSLENIDNTR